MPTTEIAAITTKHNNIVSCSAPMRTTEPMIPTEPQSNVNDTLICPKHVWQEKGGWNTISKCAVKTPNVSNRNGACSGSNGGEYVLQLWQSVVERFRLENVSRGK